MNIWSDWINWLSTWGVIKAAGMTSYMLMFTSVVLGAFSYGTVIPAKVKKVILPLHQMTGWLGFLFALLHGAVLMIDGYRSFSPKEVLIPFGSDYHTVTLGLATLALYIKALILISSDMMKRLGKKVWKSIHLLSYPMFLFALIHGVADGSDAEKTWASLLYYWSALIFIVVLMIRGYIQWKKGGKVENLASGRLSETGQVDPPYAP